MREPQFTKDVDLSKPIKDVFKYKQSSCFGKEYLPGDDACNECGDIALCCIEFSKVVNKMKAEADDTFMRVDFADITMKNKQSFIKSLQGRNISKAECINEMADHFNIYDAQTLNYLLVNLAKEFELKIYKNKNNKTYIKC